MECCRPRLVFRSGYSWQSLGASRTDGPKSSFTNSIDVFVDICSIVFYFASLGLNDVFGIYVHFKCYLQYDSTFSNHYLLLHQSLIIHPLYLSSTVLLWRWNLTVFHVGCHNDWHSAPCTHKKVNVSATEALDKLNNHASFPWKFVKSDIAASMI